MTLPIARATLRWSWMQRGTQNHTTQSFINATGLVASDLQTGQEHGMLLRQVNLSSIASSWSSMCAMSRIIVFIYRCYTLFWRGKKVREGQRVSSEQSIRQEGLRAWSQFLGRNFFMETFFLRIFNTKVKVPSRCFCCCSARAKLMERVRHIP